MQKICVVTGGGGGIGWHIGEGFHKKGYRVIALDIENRYSLIDGIDYRRMDLRKEEEIISIFESIEQEYGAIHVLINNGAISHYIKDILHTTGKDWDDIFSVNIKGAFLCSKAFIKANEGETYGRIINISSTRFNQNEVNWDLYGSSKGALISLTNSLAISLSHTPITVNAISPGWISVDTKEKISQEEHRQHPSGRVEFQEI